MDAEKFRKRWSYYFNLVPQLSCTTLRPEAPALLEKHPDIHVAVMGFPLEDTKFV